MKKIGFVRAVACIVFLTVLPTSAFAQVGKNTALLNPNLASKEELLALPQLDEKPVKAILGQRPFLSMVGLNGLLRQSVSDGELAQLYTRFFIPMNLNTASRAEILLIPRVGKYS